MPHYSDGSEAKVGDQVIGVLFNSGDKPHAGTIISITPGVETCNAFVQFTEVLPVVDGRSPDRPRMAVLVDGPSGGNAAVSRWVKGEAHGTAGAEFVAFTCADYCDTKGLTKVG